ncbi:hypothetical protein KDC22_00950 [Paenibacillus tritici]|uniref:hypothetical protein n=1 Tax=Paenibacillus tritici TaxID=1873425 RepID=UPI001BA71B9C|nr:hypothetical protein [Paenibacillus tritici]QUL55194.1 hypothetical protein KDC22_00950 [Paenibacillus tritici]
MGIFEEFKVRKDSGEVLLLNELTSEQLKTIFIDEGKTDKMISQLFEVKESQITYRRKKFGITIRGSILDDFLMATSEDAKEMNEKIKHQLLDEKNLTMISKAVTHFAFRNGPIEDMHATPNNQLSEEDMKTLNKFMVNRLAYIFKLVIEERWMEFDFLIKSTDRLYGHSWDEAEPDDGETRKIIEMLLKKG